MRRGKAKKAEEALLFENFETDLGEADLAEDKIDDEDEEELVGRRLQLIPHDVDPSRVFRFEFGPAILAQVLEKIQRIEPIALTDVTTALGPYMGFYQLFRNGESKYVGRTTRPVAARLKEHMRKLRGRVPLEEMTCRFIFVEDASLVGLSEDALIAYFHPLGLDDWGKLGFGSKATGHGRSGQRSKWHEENVADLNFPISAGSPKHKLLRQLVAQIARGAPLVLSIPRKFTAQFDRDHPSCPQLEEQRRPFNEWVELIKGELGAGWRIDQQPMAWYIVRDED
jgi:hypothetical protein